MRHLLQMACLWMMAALAHAQPWPARGLTLVVPFEAGGGHDAMARIVAEGLAARLGQSVIVANKPGASGMIGAEFVSRAAPDGYTILFASPSETVNAPVVYRTVRYDPDRTLAPVTLAGTSPIVVVAWPGAGLKSIGDLIAKAKAQPGSMSFGTAGNLGSNRLAGELLAKMAAIELTHVPYKGASLAINDVVSGQIPLAIVGIAPVMSHILAGKLVPLATTQRNRVAWARDVPPVQETPGLQGFEAIHWMGVFVPAATPGDIVETLQQQIAAVLREPERRSRLVALGIDPVGSTSAEFKAFLAADRARFVRMFQASGLKPE
jgi:tripartite-type tricarboxylate transporter receptor subunit TctC